MSYNEDEPMEIDVKLESPFDFWSCHNYGMPLQYLINTLQGVLNSVPEETRSGVMFRINQHGDQWDGYQCVEHDIYFSRLETGEEFSARVKAQKDSMLQFILNEEARLARLKKEHNIA